ncbi:kit ligand b [Denticeps clupeoides]|uniref:kit ligand b n=1 Tax=Denticeps clupeoides TaxID=299321 RepID=UPI0010A40F25|nr:uncharacterized protein LOC114765058 [Denticeps clupeoides]
MKKTKIGESPCVLLLLFSSLVASDGEGRTPVTDDVATLNLLKENIPKDYRIPIHYIPKELAGQCWLQLNIYPVERSLSQLASKFGNLSTNRENITIFITMLQGLRLMIDDEELESTMLVYKCHFRRVTWATGPYFDYIKEFFGAAAKTPGKLSCVPPPCPRPSQSPTGGDSWGHTQESPRRRHLAIIFIAVSVILSFSLWMVARSRGRCANGCCRTRSMTSVSHGTTIPGGQQDLTQITNRKNSIASQDTEV